MSWVICDPISIDTSNLIQAKIESEEKRIRVCFEVNQSEEARIVNKDFSVDTSSHGLWNFDVVEFFVSTGSSFQEVLSAPYYEFQVSPLGQFFQLKVISPRVLVSSELPFSWERSVKKTPAGWSVEMELFWNQQKRPKHLWGQFCACLGRPQVLYSSVAKRWAGQDVRSVDFHKPEFFEVLL